MIFLYHAMSKLSSIKGYKKSDELKNELLTSERNGKFYAAALVISYAIV